MHECTPLMNRFLLVALMTGSVAVVTPVRGQVINEDLKLLASDGAEGDYFGRSIAIDDGLVVVGVPHDDDNGTSSGAAYLFDADTGTQLFKFLPNQGATDDEFGDTIDIFNGIIAVGAWGTDDNGDRSGSAFLFDSSTGAQIIKLLPNDGAADDHFGVSITIGDAIVAVGAPDDDDNGSSSGSVYLFDASTGTQIRKLLPLDGAADSDFGRSIAIDNGIIAVGAWLDDHNGTNAGSAYLFDASTGVQIAKLLPSDGAEFDQFGWPIAIFDGVVAVGARGDDDNGDRSGSAYLFDASTGAQIAKLLPSDGAAGDRFGMSIALDSGVVVVGTRYDGDNGAESGSAYLFDVSTGTQADKLLPSDGAAGDGFGYSVAIDDGVIAVGADGDDDNGTVSGSAYIFDLNCVPDLNGDGEVNTLDFIAFLLAWTAADPVADWNEDGDVNTLDFLAFLTDWVAGC